MKFQYPRGAWHSLDPLLTPMHRAKCSPRSHFTGPAGLVSDHVVYGQPKPGLRFCVGEQAVSCFLKRTLLCVDVLIANMSMKVVAKDCFCLQSERNAWTMLICTLQQKCRNEMLVAGHFHMIKFGRFEKSLDTPGLMYWCPDSCYTKYGYFCVCTNAG